MPRKSTDLRPIPSAFIFLWSRHPKWSSNLCVLIVSNYSNCSTTFFIKNKCHIKIVMCITLFINNSHNHHGYDKLYLTFIYIKEVI